MSNEVENAPAPPEEIKQNIWMRGLFMLILIFFFGLAETVLFFTAVVQFLWMLIRKERHEGIASFGKSLGNWLSQTASYQSGASEEKPFPWAKWP